MPDRIRDNFRNNTLIRLPEATTALGESRRFRGWNDEADLHANGEVCIGRTPRLQAMPSYLPSCAIHGRGLPRPINVNSSCPECASSRAVTAREPYDHVLVVAEAKLQFMRNRMRTIASTGRLQAAVASCAGRGRRSSARRTDSVVHRTFSPLTSRISQSPLSDSSVKLDGTVAH